MARIWRYALICGLAWILLPAETARGSEVYREKPQSLLAVMDEFGEEPVKAIEKLLAEPGLEDKRWKEAVAALRWTGAEGADLLVKELAPRITAKCYDDRTKALLESLWLIFERRAIEYALRILLGDAPEDFKRAAIGTIEAQAEEMPMGSHATVVVKPDGRIDSAYPSGKMRIVAGEGTCSSGRQDSWPHWEVFAAVSRRFHRLLDTHEKEKSSLAPPLKKALDHIDAKLADVQEQIARIEAGEN